MASTRVKWLEQKTFLGTGSNGHGVLMSSGEHGPGVSPMQMLLLGLGGCSSVDVVEILRKQRQPLDSLEVFVDGERSDEGARPWRTIHMHFVACGDGLDSAKLARAIDLSVEKYCGAYASLSGVATITHDFEIQNRKVALPMAE
jgi:putative redox protein